jgi:uracil-DNA glycosylase family 4
MSNMSHRDAVFLDEMGIGPLWTLREAAHLPAPATATAPVPQAEPAAFASTEAVDIASMDWEQLRAAISSCTRCGLCKAGATPVHGSGAQQAQWLVVAGATNSRDEKEGEAVSGEPGKLLANMLAAVGLSRDRNAYVSNLIKCRPSAANGGDRAPTADEAAACRPYLERELVLSGATQVLSLGQIAANGLLGNPLAQPLAASRGSVHAINGVPLVSTLHPGELLLRGGDKALAWADLCLARAGHAAG